MAWATRDDNAPHQIRIFRSGNKNHVSCTCREIDYVGAAYHREPAYESMGEHVDLKHAWEIFNDPSNHQENQGQTFGTPVPKGA